MQPLQQLKGGSLERQQAGTSLIHSFLLPSQRPIKNPDVLPDMHNTLLRAANLLNHHDEKTCYKESE